MYEQEFSSKYIDRRRLTGLLHALYPSENGIEVRRRLDTWVVKVPQRLDKVSIQPILLIIEIQIC